MKIGESLPFGFEDTSYQAAGGYQGVINLVECFYQYLDTLPEAKPLRELYPKDLTRSKDKLARFLSGWLGGPRVYQEKYGEINIPRAHQSMGLTEQHKMLWLACMNRAIADQPYSTKFATYLNAQFKIPADRILAAGSTAPTR
ncbi:Group 2 truncated hemoglobin YjbI [Thalassocella blandensis]|nr:Group 2 truncated hemoglobin YjbI [Thalassocella blandensis]